ncbi:hypothetical protein ABW19_dt0200164 [Dactylella cylindrospora]|nr:hypothetical protein ABW19_dt0200164 [Dactylella cylindrospora]
MIITQQLEGIATTTHYYPETKRRQRSLTKTTVERSDAERIIKSVFNGQEQIAQFELLGKTATNSQYLITLDDSNRSKLILRTSPPSNVRILQHERDTVSGDSEILELIHENAPEIPVPRVLMHCKEPSALLDVPFLLITCRSGTTLDQVINKLPHEMLASIDYDLGMYVRRISQIHNSHFGLAGAPSNGKVYTTWKEAFLSLFESVMRDAEDLFISVPYEVLRWQVGRLAYALEEVEVPQLVCYDMTDAHVVVDEKMGKLNGLFGFERAVWGDPLMEPSFRDPSQAFLSGYGGSPLEGESARARVLLYTLHYYLRAVVEVYYRRLSHDLECKARKGLVRSLKALAEFKPS